MYPTQDTRWLLPLCLVLSCSERSAPPAAEPQAQVPQRVAVMAPAAAEMLQELDLLDRVVGIGEFGPWPETIADLPGLGRYDEPNTEQALSLGVDLVLTTASDAGAAVHDRLESLGIRVVALDTSTYDGVFASLERVGGVFGEQERARRIARRMRDELRAVEERVAGAPRRGVLFVVGRDPLYVAGPGSHIDEMIRLVGGRNVAADAASPYQQMSLEAILERSPEVIVDASDNRTDAERGRVAGTWGRWAFLPAVRDERVYQVAPGRLVIPGLRLPEMTRLMGKLVQPEVFGEATAVELQ